MPAHNTTRSTTVAHRFGPINPVTIDGMTSIQGRKLLGHPAVNERAQDELEILLKRVGHLPLALTLIKALLQEGYTIAELLAYIQAEDSALAVLALEDQPHRATNLEACFDLSYRHLTLPEHQQRFAQLGCFSGAFSIEAAAAIWRLSPAAARHKLDGLVRLSMVQREEGGYRLQRLLRDYARQKLTTEWPDRIEPTKRRHAAFYLRNRLYHPQILGTQNLGNVIEAPPSLDRSWLNIREAVHWALEHAPVLATSGAVLAHTERAAVLEMMRSRLIEAIRSSITQAPDRATAATLVEISGDLYLLLQDQAAALNCFVDAESAWSTVGNRLASSRATLRQAGVHLLNQALNETAEKMRTAQTLLAQSLPLAADDLPAARRLFYWFNLLYAALVRWEGCPKADVAHLAELAGQTGDVRLTARACHIYRLWQSVGEVDKAEQEALWSEYQLSGRCPPDVAHRFAARLSSRTPQLNPDQVKVLPQAGIRWWLQTDDAERTAWLSTILPRYLHATDSPEPPLGSTSRERRWVQEIIGMSGSLRRDSRRLSLASSQPPDGHFLNLPEWRVFSGQRALPLVDKESAGVVQQLLALLDAELVVTT